MSKKLILIVGLPGSGKSAVADFLKRKFNAGIVHSGDIIREEIRRRGLEYTPKNDALIAHWFHTGGREILVVKRVWNKIRKSNKKLIVIEGLRSEKQLKYMEKIAKIRPVVISVVASFKVRVKRELKRGRFGKEESIKYLRFRDKLEKSHGEDKLIKKADYTIDNSKLNMKQTDDKISEIMKKILTK
jgi:dephospho-CoA kinase